MKVFAIALSLVAVGVTSTYAYDFKGVELGAPATPEQLQSKLNIKCGAGGGSRKAQICNGHVTIAEESADLNLVIGESGIVERMWFKGLRPESFTYVAPQLINKFGKPTKIEQGVIQNRMGASFEQVEYTWIDKNGNMVYYSKYAGSTNSSYLRFDTKADRDFLESLNNGRAKDI